MIKVKGKSFFVSQYAFAPVIDGDINKLVAELKRNEIVSKFEELDTTQVKPDFTYVQTDPAMIPGGYGDEIYKFPMEYQLEFDEKIHIGEVNELAVKTLINSKFKLLLAGTAISHLMIETIEFKLLDENGEEQSIAELEEAARQEAIKAGKIATGQNRKVNILQ